MASLLYVYYLYAYKSVTFAPPAADVGIRAQRVSLVGRALLPIASAADPLSRHSFVRVLASVQV